MLRRRFLLVAALAAVMLRPATATAFAGLLLGRGEGEIVSRATTVVVMREGRWTVLTVRPSYEGPLADFVMVVPVPAMLRPEDVRTLPHAVFEHVVQLAAPRLVEGYEIDPCIENRGPESEYMSDHGLRPGYELWRTDMFDRDYWPRVRATLPVGEYDVEILRGRHSRRIVEWVRARGYRLPTGAEAALRAHVAAGADFFVATVAIERTRRDKGGTVMLSPLQYAYESEALSLPLRLGRVNSGGVQDLVVHVLARERYQAANRANVAIPTDLLVGAATRAEFSRFYAALLDHTLAGSPGAVVTEYAWQCELCDPCAVPGLAVQEVEMLGGDRLWGEAPRPLIAREPDALPTDTVVVPNDDPFQPTEQRAIRERASRHPPQRATYHPYGLVLTRMHLRRSVGDPDEDLVLRPASAIAGGNTLGWSTGRPRQPSEYNWFQARYLLGNPWAGPILCGNPRHGRWARKPAQGTSPMPQLALGTAFVERGADLTRYLGAGWRALAGPGELPPASLEPQRLGSGCGRCDAGEMGCPGLVVVVLGLRRRRR